MIPQYIIVQAGGKGSRLEQLTANKPKALLPIDNLPMIFHLFKKYNKSKFIIIGDYKVDVLEKYLKAFAEVEYVVVNAQGYKGTCAGVLKSLEYIPNDAPIMLIWSDLVLPEKFHIPDEIKNYIGIAKDFECRWKYEKNNFQERRSLGNGVAGLFIFENKSILQRVPLEGEFVKWLADNNFAFEELPLYNVKEYGLLSEYKKIESAKCRPFNKVYKKDNFFIKEPIDKMGEDLAKREIVWYEIISKYRFNNIPKIYFYRPLTMEYVDGMSIYEYENLTKQEKKNILYEIIGCLKKVQSIGSITADKDSFLEAYIGKTIHRLEKVRDLVPFAKDEYIMINGKKCHNIFFCKDKLKEEVLKYMPNKFKLIHGDCTFSNIMLRESKQPVLIDPRGYFGYTELYGDPAYDWAKLYYSLVGNYDQFNRKRFVLNIGENSISLSIKSNGWEDLENEFFEVLEEDVCRKQIQLLHAIIWLSLTTYAWENYDSICGAFYNGLYYLEDALN